MIKQIIPVTGVYLSTGAMQSPCWESALYVATGKYNMPEPELVEIIVEFADLVARKFSEITSLEEFQGDYAKDVAMPLGERIVRFIAQHKAFPASADIEVLARQVIMAKELSMLPNRCPHCGSVKHKPSDAAPRLSPSMPNMIEHEHNCLECRKPFVMQFAAVATASVALTVEKAA